MEEVKSSRVRWNDEELGQLAAVMAPRLLAEPGLHPLEAVRAAQECLDPARRRELKAWSLVEGRLQPKLDEALAGLRGGSSSPMADGRQLRPSEPKASALDSVDPADAQPSEGAPMPVAAAPETGSAEASGANASSEAQPGPPGHGGEATAAQRDVQDLGHSAGLFDDPVAPAAPASAEAATDGRHADDGETNAAPAGEPSGRSAPAAAPPSAAKHDKTAATPAIVTLEPPQIEAALLAALQSSAVEDALVELFARTMSKALGQASAGEPHPASAPAARPAMAQRVLLAGFPEAQQKVLTEALGARFDVRSWKPTNGPQLFETLVKLCKVVVFPEDADDDAEADLKARDVRVIRHAGNASRLIERLEALG